MKPGPTLVTCPACRKRLRIPLSAAGKTVQCPECLEDLPVASSLPVAVLAPPTPQPEAPAGNPFDFDSDGAAEPSPDAAPAVPYFTAIEARTWTANRTYRIYVREKERELVALYAGYAGDAAMAGVIIIQDPGKGRLATSQATKESTALEDWRHAHPFNFSLWAKDVELAEVVKPSFWFMLNQHTVPKIGLLKLYTTEGDWTLAPATVEDMRRLLELLPPLLGNRLEVGVIWDEQRRRFVAEE